HVSLVREQPGHTACQPRPLFWALPVCTRALCSPCPWHRSGALRGPSSWLGRGCAHGQSVAPRRTTAATAAAVRQLSPSARLRRAEGLPCALLLRLECLLRVQDSLHLGSALVQGLPVDRAHELLHERRHRWIDAAEVVD